MTSNIKRKIVAAFVSGAALLQASGCDFFEEMFWVGYDIGAEYL